MSFFDDLLTKEEKEVFEGLLGLQEKIEFIDHLKERAVARREFKEAARYRDWADFMKGVDDLMPKNKLKTLRFKLPRHDADVEIVFPGGKKLLIQARPTNADDGYNGSLNFFLPDLKQVQSCDNTDNLGLIYRSVTENVNQIITELPGDYH